MQVTNENNNLPFEFSVLFQASNMLPRTSERYVQFIERSGGNVLFNPTSQKDKPIETRDITLACLDLDLGGASGATIFTRLHGQADVRRLTICADHLTISSPLHLPGTEITIWARKLTFTGEGQISTEPKAFVSPSTTAQGMDGQNGGDIHLYVREIEAPDSAKRFITHGAAGQAAQSGQQGDPGDSITPWDGIILDAPAWFGIQETLSWAGDLENNLTEGYKPVIVKWQQYVMVTYRGPAEWVANRDDDEVIGGKWPTNGNPPKRKPGAPGLGGAGGNIYSNHGTQLGPLSSLTLGRPGAKTGDLPEAKAGTPVQSCKIRVGYRTYSPFPHFDAGVNGNGNFNRRENDRYFEILEQRITKPYPRVPAPNPRHDAKDRSGKQLALKRHNAGFWLHPMNLGTIAAYARDAFRVGRAEIARPLLAKYLSALDGDDTSGTASKKKVVASEGPELEFDFVLLRAELMDLAQRMDGPNDFFGHQAGWVPGLSFQTNAAIYKNAVKAAVERLYLSYWMENNQADKEAQIATSETAIERLQAEVRRATLVQEKALRELDDIAVEEGELSGRINMFQDELDRLTEQLERGAKDRAETEHAFKLAAKVLGGVAQVIPVGQPVVGGIGQGISALGNWEGGWEGDELFGAIKSAGAAVWDSRMVNDLLLPKLKSTASKLLEAAGTTSSSGEAEEETVEDVKKDDPFDKELEKTKLSDAVKKHIKRQSDAKDQVLGALGALTASAEEIEAATQKALANCPEYQELADKLVTLHADKSEYRIKIAAVTSALDEATNTIATARLTQISLQHGISDTASLLSPEALRYTRAMGVRALERLQRYQYYFAASYVYLNLSPLSDFDGNSEFMFNKLKDVLKTDKAAVLKGDEFDRLYLVFEENLVAVADKILTNHNETQPGRDSVGRVTSQITLELSETQLAELSRNQTLTINPMQMGKLHLSLEDIRIYNVVVREAELSNVPPEPVNLRIRLYHDGVSRIRSDGNQFQFRGAPSRWGATLYSKAGSQPVPEARDADDLSLIKHFTDGKSTDELFPRPSAWAPLQVECLNLDNIVEYNPHFKSLKFELQYTSRDLPSKQVSLYVNTGNDLRPSITISSPDISHRQNGEGNFLRTYRSGSKITLHAPERVGSFQFAGWRVPARKGDFDVTKPVALLEPGTEGFLGDPGSVITGQTLELTLDEHRFVRPIYVLPAVRQA